jgi:hypothetical protein
MSVIVDANELRSSALQKISQARHLLESARHDLCNLEGQGYCNMYEILGDNCMSLRRFSEKLQGMKQPTGVFQP